MADVIFTVITATGESKKTISYDPTNPIADGGSAQIYIGRDEQEKEVVLKIFKESNDQDAFRAPNIQEARHELALNQRCQHFTPAGYNFDNINSPILLLPRFPGTSLDRYLDDPNNQLTGEKRLALASAIAAAYQTQIVEAGIVHNDIQPGNIIVSQTEAGEFIVNFIDLGRARAFDDHSPETKQFILGGGTDEYMTPELLSDNQHQNELDNNHNPLSASTASDTFGLGKIYAYTLGGDKPNRELQDSALAKLKAETNELLIPAVDVRIKMSGMQVDTLGQSTLYSNDTKKELTELLTQSHARDPANRPTPQAIERRFAELRVQEAMNAISPEDPDLKTVMSEFKDMVDNVKQPLLTALTSIARTADRVSLSSDNEATSAEKTAELNHVLKEISALEYQSLTRAIQAAGQPKQMATLENEFKTGCDRVLQQNLTLKTLPDVIRAEYTANDKNQEHCNNLKTKMGLIKACLKQYKKTTVIGATPDEIQKQHQDIDVCMREISLLEKKLLQILKTNIADDAIQQQKKVFDKNCQDICNKHLPTHFKADMAYTQCAIYLGEKKRTELYQANPQPHPQEIEEIVRQELSSIQTLQKDIQAIKKPLQDYQAWLETKGPSTTNRAAKAAIIDVLVNISELERGFWDGVKNKKDIATPEEMARFKAAFAKNCESILNDKLSGKSSWMSEKKHPEHRTQKEAALNAVKAQLENFSSADISRQSQASSM